VESLARPAAQLALFNTGNSMSKTKREHYVPQSYLRGFTEDGEHLFAFDKSTRTRFGTSVSEIACERYFYDLSDSQATEKALSKLDGVYPCWRDSITETAEKGERITLEQQAKLAFFIAMQIRRTRWFRNLNIEIAEQVEEVFVKMSEYFDDKFGVPLEPDASMSEYLFPNKEEMSKLAQIQSMRSFSTMYKLLQILAHHIWIVGVNQTTQPFYTSDNPVVMWPHKQHPILSYSGLQSEGIEIAFPLSSRYILALLERTFHADLEALDCSSMPIENDGVVYYNGLQVAGSYRWVYCQTDSFGLAEEIYKGSS
jgi:hypothetical protein